MTTCKLQTVILPRGGDLTFELDDGDEILNVEYLGGPADEAVIRITVASYYTAVAPPTDGMSWTRWETVPPFANPIPGVVPVPADTTADDALERDLRARLAAKHPNHPAENAEALRWLLER